MKTSKIIENSIDVIKISWFIAGPREFLPDYSSAEFLTFADADRFFSLLQQVLTFWVGYFVVEAALCTAGCLAASPASTH